jgi:hypothetical protein
MIAVGAIVIAATLAGAKDPVAYETLRAAPRFAAGHVGYAGVTSREEAALHDLLSRPGAAAALRRLLSEATLAGRLYGLWGLAVLGDEEFPKLSAEYASMEDEVETMTGCIVERESVSSIVKRIRDRKYGEPASQTSTSAPVAIRGADRLDVRRV